VSPDAPILSLPEREIREALPGQKEVFTMAKLHVAVCSVTRRKVAKRLFNPSVSKPSTGTNIITIEMHWMHILLRAGTEKEFI